MWTGDATGPHHTSESDHLSGRGNKEIRGEESFDRGPAPMPRSKYEEPAAVEGKTEDCLSVERDPPADRLKWGGIIVQWDKLGCTGKP